MKFESFMAGAVAWLIYHTFCMYLSTKQPRKNNNHHRDLFAAIHNRHGVEYAVAEVEHGIEQ